MSALDELDLGNMFADEPDDDASSEGRLASPVKVDHSTRWRVSDAPAALNAGGRNVDRA